MRSASFSMAGFVYVSTLMLRIVPLGICPNGTICYPMVTFSLSRHSIALFVRMRRQCSRGHLAVRQRLSVSIVHHFAGFLEPHGLQIDGRLLRLSEVE